MVTPVLSPVSGGLITATVQSGTTYTLAAADAGTVVEFTSASPVTLTVPTNATVPFPIGTVIELCQVGAGLLSVAAAGGVTIDSPGTLTSPGQSATMYLRKRATNEWVLGGVPATFLPALISAGTPATTTAISITLTQSGLGIAPGVLMVAYIHTNGTLAGATPPANWLPVTGGSAGGPDILAFWRMAGVAESGSYLFTMSTAVIGGVICSYRGRSVMQAQNAVFGTGTSPEQVPSITTFPVPTLVVEACAHNAGILPLISVNLNTPTTEVAFADAVNSRSLMVVDYARNIDGATTGDTFSNNGSGSNVRVLSLAIT